MSNSHDIINELGVTKKSLNEDQKEAIMQMWRNGVYDLKAIVQEIFGGALDGRSLEGGLVKKFLVSKGLKPRSSFEYQKVSDDKKTIPLTDEQKKFIEENAHGMSALQIARDLFHKGITPIFKEYNAVNSYYQTLRPSEDIDLGNGKLISVYNPPKKDVELKARILRYVQNCPIDFNKMNQKQKNDFKFLFGLLNGVRFLQTIRTYTEEDDRELFEERFINFCYDKGDLLPEEVDAYINLCTDIVAFKHINARIDRLNRLYNNALDAKENEDLDKSASINMTWATSIKDAQAERSANITRQESIKKTLIQKRTDRREALLTDNNSVINLVGAWRDQDQRNIMIDYAQRAEKVVDTEVKRLMNIEQLLAMIAGVDPSEILHGE